MWNDYQSKNIKRKRKKSSLPNITELCMPGKIYWQLVKAQKKKNNKKSILISTSNCTHELNLKLTWDPQSVTHVQAIRNLMAKYSQIQICWFGKLSREICPMMQASRHELASFQAAQWSPFTFHVCCTKRSTLLKSLHQIGASGSAVAGSRHADFLLFSDPCSTKLHLVS